MKDMDYDIAEAAYFAQVIQDQNYFGLCWPNHCKKCGGWGLRQFIQSHGPGLIEHLQEPCECTEGSADNEGVPVCARCEERLSFKIMETVGEGPCNNCGWNYDDGMPSLY